ncbi:GPP34 family phosphoprotein [Candidatus Acetothermia bacterium]|nr:GPP34 family phosphoprotein [Candidatus Acetothermia bacterium]
MLNIAEKLLLLALHDEKGTLLSSASASLLYGLSGAVLLELALSKRLHIDNEILLVSNTTPTGNDILDEALRTIIASKKDRSTEDWVKALSTGIKNLKERLLDRLVQEGILRKEERRILWVIPVTRYPMQRSKIKQEIREEIRAALLDDQRPAPQTAILISLVSTCDLMGELFARNELKRATERAKKIAKESLITDAVSGTVSAVDGAVSVAVQAAIIAAVATTVTTNCPSSCSCRTL